MCVECRQTVPGKDIEEELLSQTIPYCKKCSGPAGKKANKKKKKKKESGWGANDTDDDDTIWTPKGLMKVKGKVSIQYNFSNHDLAKHHVLRRKAH